MLTSHIHPRLGLPKFLLFEPYFKDALLAFDSGKDTLITIEGGLSPNTVAARMRDSLAGLRLNGKGPNGELWKSRIDPVVWDLFWKHDGQFVIAGPDNELKIWFRAKRPKGGYGFSTALQFNEVSGSLDRHIRTKTLIAPQSSPRTAVSDTFRVADCNEATVRTMASLRAVGSITTPVAFPGPIDPSLISELIDSADIAFHYDSVRNETILL